MRNVLDSILNATSENLADEVKEELKTDALNTGSELLADITIDTAASLIPYMGNAIVNYRKGKTIRNQAMYLNELAKRVEILEAANKNNNQDYKDKVDEIFIMGSESAASTKQTEKIEYISNGVLNSIKNDFSYDISILYFSILDRLTILEIEILKQYSLPYYEREVGWNQKIIEKFKITDPGYNAARNNLLKNGLLESKTENFIQHDIDEILTSIETAQKDIINIAEFIENAKRNKKLKISKNKKTKSKTKDSVLISKLGNDFVKYFISSDSL
ncbi:hypothetical protein [Mammaliicoccus sciuri]|uniref:hypothetical protein n=1 Tax=Mammaliicoccus sciuri TaxID=1296 RepID=UPI001C4F1ADD|nr:hypothetical protein [Mammaliicoccus sciuri]